jgi:hypothetical protein
MIEDRRSASSRGRPNMTMCSGSTTSQITSSLSRYSERERRPRLSVASDVRGAARLRDCLTEGLRYRFPNALCHASSKEIFRPPAERHLPCLHDFPAGPAASAGRGLSGCARAVAGCILLMPSTTRAPESTALDSSFRKGHERAGDTNKIPAARWSGTGCCRRKCFRDCSAFLRRYRHDTPGSRWCRDSGC